MTLLIICLWCILEVNRANLLSPGAGFIRVLLIVSSSPHLMEWTVRRLHWKLGFAKGTPFEIAVLLQDGSEEAGTLAGFLQRDGLVTLHLPDREPDMVMHI